MAASQTRRYLVRGTGLAAVVAAVAATASPFAPEIASALGDFSLRAPDWSVWVGLSWVVKLHVYAALSALVIGVVILLGRKGSPRHKTLGWAWVFAMATTAVSSLFILDFNGGSFSFVHLLSGWTIIALPMAIFAIRNRKVETHRRAMTGMFVGGLLVAGLLTFIPGRAMFEMFFG
jgi:uncharacterized membrane protein